jgi:heterodisulfide reductase subunit A
VTTINTPVLILGGGVAGLSASLELARRGVPSILAERDSRLGGRVRDFCCKATQACVHCGACRLGDLVSEAATRPEAVFYTRALAGSAKQAEGAWQVELLPQPEEPEEDPLAAPLKDKTTINARAVILAVGYQPFDPRRKTRFGYGRVPGVMTALELEAMLGQGVLVDHEGQPPQSVAFIQCVGSRDESIGNLYCSRVCCGFALDMAGLIKAGWPETQVTFFHMDVQGYGPSWEEALSHMREEIDFVRAMPGEVSNGISGPKVSFAGPDGQPMSHEFGLVVLSQGLTPPASAGALTEIFGIQRNQDGFLGHNQSLCESGAPGVFVAGTAQGPRGIEESIDHAASAAAAAMELVLTSGKEAAHG